MDKKILRYKGEIHDSYYNFNFNLSENNAQTVQCGIESRYSTTDFMKYTINFQNKSTMNDEILDVHLKSNNKLGDQSILQIISLNLC